VTTKKTEKEEIVTRKQPKGVREIHLKFFEDAKTQKETRKRQPKEKTLAQIRKEQGVKPFDSSEDGKNWPKGADFQEFIDAIHSGRNNGK
jgi:hypothetical protein